MIFLSICNHYYFCTKEKKEKMVNTYSSNNTYSSCKNNTNKHILKEDNTKENQNINKSKVKNNNFINLLNKKIRKNLKLYLEKNKNQSEKNTNKNHSDSSFLKIYHKHYFSEKKEEEENKKRRSNIPSLTIKKKSK